MELLDILFWLPFPPKLDIIYACSPLQNTKYIDIYIRLETIHLRRRTVWDMVPKEDAANLESDAFLWFAYVVNISKIETFLGRFWIFG